MSNLGTVARGIRLPLIKAGDNVAEIVANTIIETSAQEHIPIKDKDIIAVTESIVARAENNYISVQDIADDIVNKYGENQIITVLWPIYSRNRFSMILKGIARGAKEVRLLLNYHKDEVGNDIINPFTNINIINFYRDVIESEDCKATIIQTEFLADAFYSTGLNNILVATIHSRLTNADQLHDISLYNDVSSVKIYTLADICSSISKTHGYNSMYGVLGSNKATDDTLKLFPRTETCENIVNKIQQIIAEKIGKHVEVMIYGDGCFKDPVGQIWEFADPVVSPAYTDGLVGTPNELKLKYIADNENKTMDEIIQDVAAKDKNLIGQMRSEGTTPRKYTDLIGSLCDLVSGSGDKGTPVVWIQDYFKNISEK